QPDNPFFHLELHPIIDEDETGFIKTYKSKRSGSLHIKGMLERFGLEEVLLPERHDQAIFLRNDHIPEAARTQWEEPFRLLKETLNARQRFHCLVIDQSYSHTEATGFVFRHGFLSQMGKFDTEALASDISLDDLEDYQVPQSINDQVIGFIEKNRNRYTIIKLNDEGVTTSKS